MGDHLLCTACPADSVVSGEAEGVSVQDCKCRDGFKRESDRCRPWRNCDPQVLLENITGNGDESLQLGNCKNKTMAHGDECSLTCSDQRSPTKNDQLAGFTVSTTQLTKVRCF